MKISIAGTIGSGKSSISKRLATELGYPRFSVGDHFRKLAQAKGMSIEEWYKLAEQNPEIDRKLGDQAQAEFGERNPDCIIDSRLGWYFIPESEKIFLTCDLDIAAQRILGDHRASEVAENVEELKTKIQARVRSEIERYQALYGINHLDPANFDLVLDTTELTEDEVLEKVLNYLKA